MTATWAGDPRTWAGGELDSASMDTEIRDRMDWLRAALLLHGIDSASTLGYLTGARYGVYVTADESVPDATDKVIGWDVEEWDDDGFWTGANAGRVTIPADGTYEVKAWGLYEANGNGAMRGLELLVNGSDVHAQDRRAHAGGSFQTSVSCEKDLELVAGDYVQVRARHNAGATLSISAFLQVRRVASA